MSREYRGPIYPGSVLRHLGVPGVLFGLGLLIQHGLGDPAGVYLDVAALGMITVLLYGNMKYSSYFAGTVEEHTENRSRQRKNENGGNR